jgi:hypothetical protein
MNHRGEVAIRKVRPIRLWFGSTAFHREQGWFLEGFDLDRLETRDYAMLGMLGCWKTLDKDCHQEEVSSLLDREVFDLNLSMRARKALVLYLGVSTIGGIIKYSAKELLQVRNLGATTLSEIRLKLSSVGLALRDDPLPNGVQGCGQD